MGGAMGGWDYDSINRSLPWLKRQNQATVTDFLLRYEEAVAGVDVDELTNSDRQDDDATASWIDHVAAVVSHRTAQAASVACIHGHLCVGPRRWLRLR